VAAERGNIVDIEHHREGMNIHLAETEVQLTVVTRDEEHCAQLCRAMEEHGYRVERLS
jgi:ACT domain-containing protein